MEKPGQKRLTIAGVVLVLVFFVELLFSPISSVLAQIGNESFLPLIAKEYPPIPTPTRTPIPTPTKTPIPTPEPTPVGPVGGTFTALVVDPSNSQIVYGGSYLSGVYKTFNQGNTWYRKSSGLGNVKIQSLAIHPTNSSIVYAGTYEGGVYKSTNGGDNWFAINSGITGNKVIVYDLEIDSINPNTLYAAIRLQSSLVGYIYKSNNGGASWTLIFTGKKGSTFSSDDYFYDIDVNPLNSNELYLSAHEHGFYKSSNGGGSFFAINSGVNDFSARTFAIDKSVPGLIYGGVWHDEAVFRTVNAGSGWVNRRNGLPSNAAVFRLYPDPFTASPMRIFASTYGDGIYATVDKAENWSSVGLNGEKIYDFVIANGNPQRWFAATENNGVFRRNASGSWSKVMGDLRLNAVTSLENDSDNQVNYAAVYGKGIYAVDSSGVNWLDLTENLGDKAFIDLLSFEDQLVALTETAIYWRNGSEWTEIDLPLVETSNSNPNKDYLTEKIGLPAESLDLHISLANENQLLLNQNVVKSFPYRLILHQDQLYLATLGDGIFRRDDDEWKSVGFVSKNVIDLASEGDALFALVCGAESDCLVYRSVEDDWLALGNGLEGQAINTILLSRGELWAGTDRGIYRYDSDRELWIQIAAEGRNILSLTDSGDCRLAAGSDGAVLYLNDCGESWQEIELETGSFQSLSYLEESTDLILLGSRDAGAFLLRLP